MENEFIPFSCPDFAALSRDSRLRDVVHASAVGINRDLSDDTGMFTYVAMLRGVNVSGHKTVPMERLRKYCEKLGLSDVRTYIQSGNIVFRSKEKRALALSRKISEMILKEFGFTVPVIMRNAEELASVVQENPFAKLKAFDPAKLLVIFFSEAPPKSAIAAMESLPLGADRFAWNGRELLLYCTNGIGKSKLAAVDFERLFSVRFTGRNWNTVNKLLEMLTRGESFHPQKKKV